MVVKMKVYVLLVFLEFNDQVACQNVADQYYANDNVKCTMFIRNIPRAMPIPLNRPEAWSCKKRPTLCYSKSINNIINK